MNYMMDLRGPFPRQCVRATQLLLKQFRSGGEQLATLCSIWMACDLNLRPPAPEANALPQNQLAGFSYILQSNPFWILHLLN